MTLTAMASPGADRQRVLVVFQLDRQKYALPIEALTQIIEMVTITPLPQVNHALEGVINVRGAAVPVVSLRHYLGLPETDRQLHTPIILVQMGERMIGLIVDQVVDVLNLPAQCIVRLSDILPAGLDKTPLVQGLARVQADMVVLLDLDLLFSISQMSLVTAATCEEPVEPAVPEHEGAQEASAVELTPEIET